ncbi:uncharacterized protein si:dkeyp-69c1.9 [Anabas testudineus]|uniref:uncharacterized protein si:dkeyp-69c1.9 n=1 Tax=Anabas testudineus TaxID=64144 RepID=UPI000E45A029|nr:uncharacterized protein si:dkeyp-69c1.9 [Anabas testudineus]XP_026226230.1 uncharacterized protein si:dkeyp-69c1.9 [Anabas testudineus]XP_026226231.1 uncharacterized protein si:dkeyp-69c1.9 [Anabas testudineus]
MMPEIQQHSQETTDKMFVENANVQHPRPHHDLLLRSRPYRGEPPTVAGFLLYPDTPAKMETTSREAFSFRPIPQQERGKGDHIAHNTQQQSHSPHPTSSRQTGRGNSSSSRDKEAEEDEQEGKHSQQRGSTAVQNEDPADMQSQYQKDFPPPSSCRRRRTPALPQPDNIGINPAFRIEFSTVQRENFPGWPIMNPRLRVTSQGRPEK